jgi:hypothetical protein
MKPLQLFDPASSTYTYILFDADTRDALLIDPVDDQLARDLAALREHGLKLALDHRDSCARRPHHQRGPAGRAHRCENRCASGLRHRLRVGSIERWRHLALWRSGTDCAPYAWSHGRQHEFCVGG